MTKMLEVRLHGTVLGNLIMLPSRKMFVSFDEQYVNASCRNLLSQSFFRPSGELILESKTTFVRLPAFFSNLLPEGPMREYLARLGNVKPTEEFRLIELLGEDLPGAVTVAPQESARGEISKTHSDEEKDFGRRAYRFSLAGVQLKFSAVTERHGGLTIPASGVGGDWIIKLPAQNYQYVPENEFAMMSLASSIGIPIPEKEIGILGQA